MALKTREQLGAVAEGNHLCMHTCLGGPGERGGTILTPTWEQCWSALEGSGGGSGRIVQSRGPVVDGWSWSRSGCKRVDQMQIAQTSAVEAVVHAGYVTHSVAFDVPTFLRMT